LLFNFFLEHRERKIIDNNDERQRQLGNSPTVDTVFRSRYNVSSTTAMSPIFPERKQHENV